MMNSKISISAAVLAMFAGVCFQQMAMADGSIVINGRPVPRNGARAAAVAPANALPTAAVVRAAAPQVVTAEQVRAVLVAGFGEDGSDLAFQIDATARAVHFVNPLDGQHDTVSFEDVVEFGQN
jgi:hypothetical protein